MPSLEASEANARAGAARSLNLAALALLLAVALGALAFQLRLPGRFPAEDDYLAAARILRAEGQRGDALLLHPWWTERARLFMPPDLDVIGYLGSGGDSLWRASRIWVLSQPDLPRSGTRAFQEAFLPGRERLGEERKLGKLRLSLYRNGRHRPLLFSAAESYREASVYLERQGLRSDCSFDGRVHRCPGPPHLYVAPEWHELAFVPRRCLWMHPPGGDGRLVMELPALPEGARFLLEGGLFWEHAGRKGPQLTPVHIGVDDAASGKTLVDLAIPPGLVGMQSAHWTPGGEGAVSSGRAVVGAIEQRRGKADLRGALGPGRRLMAGASSSLQRFERYLPWALFAASFLALFLSEASVGFVRDESVYFAAGESYAQWFKLLFTSPGVALGDAAIVPRSTSTTSTRR